MDHTEPDIAPVQPVLLIDLDNCPQHLSQLSLELKRFSRIIACYGSVEPKLGLSVVLTLATAIHEGRLEFIQMPTHGKNAADFGLAFWAGRLLATTPPDTEFEILSGDHDLDHVVALLRREHRRVRRVGKSDVPVKVSSGDAVQKFIGERLRPGIPRPKQRQSLMNHIRSFLQSRPGVAPEGVLKELMKRGVVRVGEDGVVSYQDGALARA